MENVLQCFGSNTSHVGEIYSIGLVLVKSFEKAGVTLDQNCIRLSDATLEDLFLKNFFDQKQCKYAMNIGVAQIRGALLVFWGKISDNKH